MRWIAMLVAAALALAGAVRPAGAAVRDLNTIREGDAVPSFSGRTLDGGTLDVGELLGEKVLVLAFWSIYCKPCVEEISALIRLQEQLGGDRFQVVGVNADSELGVARIRTFMARFEEYEKRKINYPNIFDEGNAVSKLLGVGFLPTVVTVNLKGQVERIFMGFEEKSEAEIFTGIRRLLPVAGAGEEAPAEEAVFAVDAAAPLCGFYDAGGWKASFQEGYELQEEVERIGEIARRKALKAALRDALRGIGLSLLANTEEDGCFLPYGVYLAGDPMLTRDGLGNLLREINLDRLAKVVESQEAFIGTEYRVSQRVSVNLTDLRAELERLRYQVTPRTVTFSVVNLRKLDLARFERTLARQSRYLGFANFPTYSIYTTAEVFADEVKGMDFGGLKLFVEEAEGDRIEVEVWR